MIDMGFEESLLKVLEAMPSSSWKSENEEEAEKQEKDTHQTYRTTIMFSATMPPPVERIAKKYVTLLWDVSSLLKGSHLGSALF